MRNIKITRAATGYVLRTRKWVDILLVCSMFCVFIISAVSMLVAPFGVGVDAIGARIAIFVLGVVLAVSGVFGLYFALGQRITLDNEGVHFGRTLAKTRHIPWRDVRDWGIVYQYVRGGKCYYLYFASVQLTICDNGENKRLPNSFKRAVYLGIAPKDIPDLRDLGVISYCRRHLGWDDETAETHVPLFIADEARSILREQPRKGNGYEP